MIKFFSLLIPVLFLISCKGEAEKETSPERSTTSPGHSPIIVIETSMGTIKAQLHEKTAPVTVKNFLGYVDDSFYDNTIFHRVISNFMIQGGGFEIPKNTPKEKASRAAIRNESQKTKKNTRGTLAMARTSDPHSATNQFFINVKDNSNLDYPNNGGGYAVFGEVIEGMEIVDQIKAVKTHATPTLNLVGKLYQVSSSQDVPIDPVFIKSIRRAAPAQ